MWSITLTQPWATLCVSRLKTPLVVDAAWGAPQPLGTRRLSTLIPAGKPPKRHETRTFRPIANAVNMVCLIHAAKGDATMRTSLLDPENKQRLREPYASALKACGYTSIDPWSERGGAERNVYYANELEGGEFGRASKRRNFDGIPLSIGALVGAVRFIKCRETIRWWDAFHAGDSDAIDFLLGNWDGGRFAWTMVDPIEFYTPIEARGYQGFWKTDAHTDTRVREQLARTPAGSTP